MTTSSDNPKARLRRECLALRSRLPLPELNRALQSVLSAWPNFRASHRILCYAAFRGEIDLMPLIAAFPEKQWYLPVTSPVGESFPTPGPAEEASVIPTKAG